MIDHPRTSTDALVSAIERLVVGGIGVTVVALGDAPEASELTFVQWRGLVVTTEHDGVRVGGLASTLGMSVPSASRLVRRLERRGLITLTRDERDRRATLVHPTAEGRRVMAAVTRRREALLRDALAGREASLDPSCAAAVRALADALGSYA